MTLDHGAALASLDEHQFAAATADGDHPLAVVAGPGAGKTRTVVARIAHLVHLGVDPSSVLALTHTQRAAGELSDRLSAAGLGTVRCSTFHAAAWRQLRSAGERRELVADPWPMVREAATREVGRLDPAQVSDVAGEIEWARGRLVDHDDYPSQARAQGRNCALDPAQVVRVWRRFDAARADAGVLDFGDVLAAAAELYESDPASARAAFGHVVVDEYQDADRAQQRLLDAWLAGRGCLTVVGDPEQSIFSFKGADPALIGGFTDRYRDARVVHLVANHRSSHQVVEWVNTLTVDPRPPLVATFDGPAPKVRAFGHERDEDTALARQLMAWHKQGVPFSEMAVLYRYNASGARLEQALAAASVPYHVAGSARFFDRPEVRSVLVPFGRDARSGPDRPGVELLVATAVRAGFDPERPPSGMGVARQRWEAVVALVELCRSRHRDATAAELLAELLHRAREQHDPSPGGVTLATAHSAKGLEWDCVWVAGCVEGQFPSSFASTDDQLVQEQHLLYVAVSRARHHLVVSHSARRHNNWRSNPSRYLSMLPRQGGAASSASSRRTAGSKGSSQVGSPSLPKSAHCRCGGRLVGAAARSSKTCSAACLTGAAARRHATLVDWRTARAAELGRPVADVATDKALFTMAVTGATSAVPGLAADAGTPDGLPAGS